MHTTLGYSVTEKCVALIANTFQVRGLGRKVMKFVSRCDTYQRVKHPNRNCAVQNLNHLPKEPGDLCAIDLYGPLPVGLLGLGIYLCVSTCFRNFLNCTH
jgi:hypothetical protein